MNITLRALAGLSVWSMAMVYGPSATAQAPAAPAPAAPAPYPGYPQPAPGYPQQQAPGYPQPTPGYQQPAPGHPPEAPVPGYGHPAPGYWQPAPGYGAPIVAAPAGPHEWYDLLYGHIGGVMGFHGWGSIAKSGRGSDHSDGLSGRFRGGVLLAGYTPITPRFHLGGYFSYSSGDMLATLFYEELKYSVDHLSIGFSLKGGSMLHERVWLGVVTDLGYYSLSTSDMDVFHGIEVSPRLHLDVLGLNAHGFKMGAFASLGPTIVPYAGMTQNDQTNRMWFVYITLCLGATFGS